ncbi:MAG: VCBS repeat-containing protein, partial [Planctomycetota bacterium]
MNYENEPSEQDDAIIGQAFRWSLAAIIPVAAIIFATYWYVNRKPDDEEVVIKKNTEEVKTYETDKPEIPEFKFTDISEKCGIDFVHHNGATGEKLLPETMGGGVAVIDYDSDGLPDLFFVDSKSWDESDKQPSGSRLYRNLGGGSFEDVSQATGILESVSGYGMGCAVGDFDNDGDPDLFVSNLGRNQLLQNNEGVFSDITERSGVAGGDETWSTSCGFFDYDQDGDLDLFVCNYIQWSREIDFELNFSLNGKDRAYGPPSNYRGAFSYLYRNEGNGTFVDVSQDAGLQQVNPDSQSPIAKALAVAFIDADQDGHTDILVANDTVQNQLFHNLGNGKFEEIGSLSGMAFDRDGQATGAMGIDIGFPFSDRRIAIGIGNFANEMTSLYVRQDAPLVFADESLAEGIGAPSRSRLTFGLVFADFDLDGRVDMLQTNGHLEEEINEVQPSQTYRQPAQLFWNQ